MQQGRTSNPRPSLVHWTSLWGLGLTFALVATVKDIFWMEPGTPAGRDFANLYVAGKLALEGYAYQAFDVDSFRFALRDVFGTFIPQNYSYPPHALLLAVPVALVPYWLAFMLWTAVTAAMFYWAAKPYVPFAPILSILTPAAALNMWNGHYGLLLGALWLWFFQCRGARAGLIASLLTIKPHMGLFIGVAALRDWRTLTCAVAGTLALVALSAWLFGPSTWYGFIGNTVGVQTEILTLQSDDFYFRMMPGAFTAFGGETFGIVTQCVFAAAAVTLLIRSGRVDPFAFATATFLVVPYVFVYDLTVVCLGFAILLWQEKGSLTPSQQIGLSLAFLVPNITIALPALAPPILLWGLAIQTGRLRAVAGPKAI